MALEAETYTKLREDPPSGRNCLKSWEGNEPAEIKESKQGTDSAYNSHSTHNTGYLDNSVEEVKHRLF